MKMWALKKAMANKQQVWTLKRSISALNMMLWTLIKKATYWFFYRAQK